MKKLNLLGPALLVTDAGVTPLTSDRASQMLVYLAFHRDWRDRGQLGEMFWPSLVETAARRNVRKGLHNIRKLGLRDELQTHGDLVRIVIDMDVHVFEAAVQERRYAEALTHVRGRFGDHLSDGRTMRFDNWLDGERARIGALWRKAAHMALPEMDAWQAAQTARSLLLHDPFDETALRALLQALVVTGSPGEARRVALAAALRFQMELGTGLSALTQARLRELGLQLPSASDPMR